MIIFRLFKQNRIKTFRAKGFYKNLTVNIIMGIFALYFITVFFILGLFLDKILETVPLEYNPPQLFGGMAFYLLFFGLIIRFFMQSLSRINVNAYKMLPIPYSTLVNYIVFKPFLNLFNYLPLITIIPFAGKSVSQYYGGGSAVCFILLFILISMFNTQLAALLKRVTGGKLLYTFGFLGLIALAVFGDYKSDFLLFKTSSQASIWLIEKSYRLLIPIAFVALTTWLHRRYFFHNYYTDDYIKKTDSATLKEISLFSRLGTTGAIMNMETILIMRHKRSRNMMYMSIIFFLYGFLFYTSDLYGIGYKMMCGVIVTGMAMMMFGQWVFSWDSNNFDFILSKNISAKDYVRANYYLMLLLCILSFIIASPYFFFGKEIFFIQCATFSFNIGISIPIMIYFGTYNHKRVDLKNSSAMNFQGTTFKNFLIILPVMFLPSIIAGVASALSNDTIALGSIAIVGFLGLIFVKPILLLCEKQFIKKKYQMADGFRAVE